MNVLKTIVVADSQPNGSAGPQYGAIPTGTERTKKPSGDLDSLFPERMPPDQRVRTNSLGSPTFVTEPAKDSEPTEDTAELLKNQSEWWQIWRKSTEQDEGVTEKLLRQRKNSESAATHPCSVRWGVFSRSACYGDCQE